METALEARLDGVPLTRDAAWLQLPIAKKAIGLRRLAVMLEYDRERTRTKAEAQAAADQLGIKLRSFYALLKHWREEKRSPFALVPFGSEVAPRRSRLDPTIAEKLRELASACVSKSPSAPAGELVSRIKLEWMGAPGLPSDVTIRSYLDRARVEHKPVPGTISAEALGFNKQDKARGFGDVLIVDHTAPADILVRTPDGTIAPTITLIIDEFTRAPIGEFVYERLPNGDAVLSALDSARYRVARLAPRCGLDGSTVVFASTFDREWRGLGEELNAQGFSVNERAEARLPLGQVVRQLIGTTLDTIALQSSSAARKIAETDIDPERKSLLSLRDASFVIGEAVDRLSQQLVASDQPNRAKPKRGRGKPSSKRVELHGGFSSVDPVYDGREVPVPDFDMQRAQDAFLQLRGKRSRKRPVAETGSSPDGRSPEIFARQLERLAREIAGDKLIALQVTSPCLGMPTWHVAVTVNDPVAATPIWIELAREAVNLADLELTLVRVIVEAESANG